MGWKPSDHHGGLKEIIETKQVPVGWCITDSEYLEGPDITVTGWRDKQRKLAALDITEQGDRVGGARMESPKNGRTLTFDMSDPQSKAD